MTHNWRAYFVGYDDRHAIAKISEHAQYHEPAYQALRRRLRPAARILDVGCGIGASVIYLSSQGYDCHGIDNEPLVVDRARDIAGTMRSIATFRVAQATELPFADNSFDAALSLGVLEHFDDAAFVVSLREQARVASLVLTVLPTRLTSLCNSVVDERFFSRQELRQLHKDAGLRPLAIFGYGDPAGTFHPLHRALHYLLPSGVGLWLQRHVCYAMQQAVLAERA